MTFKRVEEIDAWQRGMKLAEVLYAITSGKSFEKDWGLRDQMRRAAVSIPSNIAEGFERVAEGDFNRFVLIAKGSCGELRTQILLSGRIGYLNEDESTSLSSECLEISAMLGGLSKYLVQSLKK
jgi:four helix bundle protein